MFDSGGLNLFGPQQAKRWGITVSGGVNFGGAGARSVEAGFGRVNSVAIGAAHLDDEIAVVAPLPWPSGPGTPAGLSGHEFLAEFRTTIDYPKKTLTFEPFSSPLVADGTKLPFYSDGFAIYVTAKINGAPGLFRVDTGDGRAVTLFKTFANKHNVVAQSGHVRSGLGFGGAIAFKKALLDEFTFGPSTLHRVATMVSQTKAGAFYSRTIAGNLGGSLFRCYRMTFDYRARLVVVTPGPSTSACLAKLSVKR
jgi:hypothetical protein